MQNKSSNLRPFPTFPKIRNTKSDKIMNTKRLKIKVNSVENANCLRKINKAVILILNLKRTGEKDKIFRKLDSIEKVTTHYAWKSVKYLPPKSPVLQDSLKINPRKKLTSVNRRRMRFQGWLPNLEEQKFLYTHLSFIVEKEESGKDPILATLWRIWNQDDEEDHLLLQKFTPKDLNGRIFHFATAATLSVYKDKDFYIRYLPVYSVLISDTEKYQVVQYFNIPRVAQSLLQIRQTDQEQLFKDMIVVVQAIVQELLEPGFIKNHVSADSIEWDEFYKSSWDGFEQAIASRLKLLAIEAKILFKSRLITILKLCPTIKYTLSKNADCEKCVVKTTRYKMMGIGMPYDIDFTEKIKHKKFNKLQAIDVCYSCGNLFKIMHHLLHYKWWIYAGIRIHITDLIGELEEDENLDRWDIINSLVKDHEWCIKTFLGFQVALFDADREISKMKKINASKLPSLSNNLKTAGGVADP